MWCLFCFHLLTGRHNQLNPTLTDFKGLMNFIFYRWNSVRVNIGNKKKLVKGTVNLHLLQAEFR